MLEPQQAYFIAVRHILTEKYPGKVYDGELPGEGTEYPFIYLGEFSQTDTATKSVILGSIPATVHVWHDCPHQRGTVSNMISDVKSALRAAAHKDYAFLARNVSGRIIPDNTTSVPLMHGIVEAEVLFSPRH